MEILSLDLDEILSKIETCKYLYVSGDFDAKSFEEFYFKMKAIVLKNEIYPPKEYASYLKFFTSLANQAHYKSLFREERKDIWEREIEFHLDLMGQPCKIAEYESTDFSSKGFSRLHVNMRNSEYFHLLNDAFNNTRIISVNLTIYRLFNHFNELVDVLNQKSILSLTLTIVCMEDDNTMNFFVGLSDTLFWNGLKHFYFESNSLQMMLKGLEYLPQNLETLELNIRQSSNGQFGRIVDKSKWEIGNNEFVKELVIICRNEDGFTNDFEQLSLLFPNLRKLVISGCFKHLKPFKIKNSQVKEFKIICESLENEDNFIRELINSQTLASVYIKIRERVIKWKKDDRIYGEFVFTKIKEL